MFGSASKHESPAIPVKVLDPSLTREQLYRVLIEGVSRIRWVTYVYARLIAEACEPCFAARELVDTAGTLTP